MDRAERRRRPGPRRGADDRRLPAGTRGADGGPRSFETIVVLDACQDATRRVVREAAAELGIRIQTLEGPGEGAGAARRLGMDAAATRLFALGHPEGLIACTDADSRPAADWLERQLIHAAGEPAPSRA